MFIGTKQGNGIDNRTKHLLTSRKGRALLQTVLYWIYCRSALKAGSNPHYQSHISVLIYYLEKDFPFLQGLVLTASELEQQGNACLLSSECTHSMGQLIYFFFFYTTVPLLLPPICHRTEVKECRTRPGSLRGQALFYSSLGVSHGKDHL